MEETPNPPSRGAEGRCRAGATPPAAPQCQQDVCDTLCAPQAARGSSREALQVPGESRSRAERPDLPPPARAVTPPAWEQPGSSSKEVSLSLSSGLVSFDLVFAQAPWHGTIIMFCHSG